MTLSVGFHGVGFSREAWWVVGGFEQLSRRQGCTAAVKQVLLWLHE